MKKFMIICSKEFQSIYLWINLKEKNLSQRTNCEELMYTLFSLIQEKLPWEHMRGKIMLKIA